MEWPSIDVALPNDDNDDDDEYDDDDDDDDEYHYNYLGFSQDESGAVTKEEYVANLITTLVTKEIYARAAKAAVSRSSGIFTTPRSNNSSNSNSNNSSSNRNGSSSSGRLEERVDRFLDQLREADDNWNTEYRNIARSFTELMAEARPRSRTIDICQAGLDAVHDLLKYRLPSGDFDDDDTNNKTKKKRNKKSNNKTKKKRNKKSNSNNSRDIFDTILPAKDAYVLCNSFPTIGTKSVTGSRAPDISYRYGLLSSTPESNDAYAGENGSKREPQPTTTVGNNHRRNNNRNNNNYNNNYNNGTERRSSGNTAAAIHTGNFVSYGREACEKVAGLRGADQLETSAASLACHTLTNTDLVQNLAHKTFVVLGCDHPLSPTKPLLRIPGVTVLGIPSSRSGLADLLEYIAYNAPDDTTFVYPDDNDDNDNDGGGFGCFGAKDENLVLTKGPHIAQWILGNTKFMVNKTEKEESSSSSSSFRSNAELVLVPMPLPSPTINLGNGEDPTNPVSTRVRESAVRWAAASDLILQRVLQARSDCDRLRCSVWSYQSSTTCTVVPASSATKSTELLEHRPPHESWLHKLSMGTILTPTIEENNNNNNNNTAVATATATETTTATDQQTTSTKTYGNHDYSIVNGILTLEGPHHMLAEHIRMWRAMVINYAREYRQCASDSDSDDDDDDDDYGGFGSRDVHVFAPHVPLSISPMRDAIPVSRENARLLNDPLRVFDAGSVASLLAAISIAGLADPIVNRPLPLFPLTTTTTTREAGGGDFFFYDDDDTTTPFAMFWYGSFHGGIWNCPYTLESVSGSIGYFLGKAYEYYHQYYAAAESGAAGDTTKSSSERIIGAGGGDANISSIVDAVPSADGDLPDYVQEHVRMCAGP